MTGREDEPGRSRGAPKRRLGTALLVALGLLASILTGRGNADEKMGGSGPKEDEKDRSPSGWIFVCVGFVPIGLAGLAIGGYAWSLGKWSVAAVAFLVAAGAFAAGGMFGFLFGVPHLVAPATSTTGEPNLRSSANLEEISDWLTKILVGLGLVELRAIIASGKRFVFYLEPAFGGPPSGATVALADITFFAVAGFVALYYITRVFVAPALKQVEDELRKKIASLQQVERDTRETVAGQGEALGVVRKEPGVSD